MPEDIDTKIVKAFLWYIVPTIYLLPAIKYILDSYPTDLIMQEFYKYHFNDKWLFSFI